jgi:hypothetical protein
MPTDGQNFQARKPNVGKFFSALRDGASNQILVEYAIAGLAREIANRLQMPEMGSLVDALASNPGALFARNVRSATDHIHDVVGRGLSNSPDCEATRHLRSAARRAAIELRESALSANPDQYRKALHVGIGRNLLQEIILDSATDYSMHHRKIDLPEVKALWGDLDSRSAARLGELVASVCASPRGVPAAKFSKGPTLAPKVDSKSRESLLETTLAPFQEVP